MNNIGNYVTDWIESNRLFSTTTEFLEYYIDKV